jgi:hypothetical protein
MSDLLEAPKHSLPAWGECSLRVDNRQYLESAGAIKDGVLIDDYYCDSLLPDPIHEFIYEYDDADPYKSAWFMHRLELAINHAKAQHSEQLLSALKQCVAAMQRDVGGEPLPSLELEAYENAKRVIAEVRGE